MTTATKAPPKYTVSKIRTFIGNEGHGFNATLHRDGKVVAEMINDASGGSIDFRWLDRSKGSSKEEEIYRDYIKEFRPDDKIGSGDDQYLYLDLFAEELVDAELSARTWKRICKKNTIVQIGKDIGTEKYRRFNGIGIEVRKFVLEFVTKRFQGQKFKILNDDYFPEQATQAEAPALTDKNPLVAAAFAPFGKDLYYTLKYEVLPYVEKHTPAKALVRHIKETLAKVDRSVANFKGK